MKSARRTAPEVAQSADQALELDGLPRGKLDSEVTHVAFQELPFQDVIGVEQHVRQEKAGWNLRG